MVVVVVRVWWHPIYLKLVDRMSRRVFEIDMRFAVLVTFCQNRVVHVPIMVFDCSCLNVSCSSRSYVVFPCLMALTSAKRRYVVHLSALVMLYENVGPG